MANPDIQKPDLKTTPSPTTRAATILRASGIRKSFRMGDSDITVLKQVDLTVREGEFLAIEGRSGSGKSTLMHILGALDCVDAGTVEFDGQDYTRRAQTEGGLGALFTGPAIRWTRRIVLLAALGVWVANLSQPLDPVVYSRLMWVLWPLYFVLLALYLGTKVYQFLVALHEERRSAPLRNKQFGFVFQFYHLLPELNVLENTMLALMVEHSWLSFRLHKGRLRAHATELLDQLGLGHRLAHRPNQLSGGERQRVAIARALINNPRILFADEPTGNLDAETGQQIMTLLETLHRERGQTIIMVTHDRAIAGEADRVLLLKDGRLVSEK